MSVRVTKSYETSVSGTVSDVIVALGELPNSASIVDFQLVAEEATYYTLVPTRHYFIRAELMEENK